LEIAFKKLAGGLRDRITFSPADGFQGGGHSGPRGSGSGSLKREPKCEKLCL
jgi:hypothetical protein